MTKVNSIKEMYFQKGMSYAEIARVCGNDVKTIKKYVLKDDFNIALPEPKPDRTSKLDPYKSEIDEWLEKDKCEKVKQRHTAKQVYKRLSKAHEDFDCSYRLVTTYVSRKKREIYKAGDHFFMPLVHVPGEVQVDFGEADFIEKGCRVKGHYLNVSFPYSNGAYTQLFKGENLQCLLEGLVSIFDYMGGVPRRLWFDNMSTAVKSILKGGKRNLTDGFLRFKNHYGFEAAFCNPYEGHEKGNVENKVGYHRRNFFVPVPEFDNLEQYNKGLFQESDEDMLRIHYRKRLLIKDLLGEDKKALMPLPRVSFDGSETRRVRTDGYAKFTLNAGRHTYSTAPKYAKSTVHAKLTAHEVIVLDENYREILRHKRLYGDTYQESMDWLPYLGQLSKRPAALKYTGIYPMLPEEVRSYLDSCDHNAKKETLKVLFRITEKSSFSTAVEAVRAAVTHDARDTDSLIALFNRLEDRGMLPGSFIPPKNVPCMPKLAQSLPKYDQIFLGEAKRHEV